MYSRSRVAPVRISKPPLLRSAKLLAATPLTRKVLLERKAVVADENSNKYGSILLAKGGRGQNQHIKKGD